jgi:hypothetical protein
MEEQVSELTDKLRREGLRPSIVSKIDWLMDDLETEVADVIREALLNEGELDPDWVEEAEGYHEEAVAASVEAMHSFKEKHLTGFNARVLKEYEAIQADVRRLQWKAPEQ